MPRPKGRLKTGGRQSGTPNKRRIDGEAYARSIVEDPIVRAKLLEQAQAGVLPYVLMQMLFSYAYGKPYEVVENGDSDSQARTIRIHF